MITQVLESSAVWGVLLTLAAFGLGVLINKRTGKAIFNPLLLGTAFVIVVLSVLKIPYDTYAASASPISYLLLPATVSLAVPLDENLDIAEELLDKSQAAHTVLEIEIGAVGGEEDGHSAEINDKLYSTPAQGIAVAQRLGLGERGRYMAAFTFGNVHGAYKPGVVKLRPELLDEIQTTVALAIKAGEMPDPAHSLDVAPGKPFALVFHGGSGSAPEEIAQAVSYGVVKMNIDTDTQYAFSRAVAGHMFSNYDSVLKIDGEVGNKKMYDPRSWGREAESAMAARVVEACKQLGSAGRALN